MKAPYDQSIPIYPIKLGESSTFDNLFRAYYSPLCTFSNRYLKDIAEAEEIVSLLFENMWKKNTAFESDAHLRSFLYRSVYNSTINYLRGNERRHGRESSYGAATGEIQESFLHAFLRTETIAEIYREIEQLPQHYAAIIKMSYSQGLKNEEIAHELGLSVQTIKNYKHKALGILKHRLPKDAWIMFCLFFLSN